MARAGVFSIDFEKILNRTPGQDSTSKDVGTAGIQEVPVYVLKAAPTKAEIKFLNFAWLRILLDPKPPAQAVTFIVELTCSAYFDVPSNIFTAIKDNITPGANLTPVEMTGIGTFGIPSDRETEACMNSYFKKGCLSIINDKDIMSEVTEEDGLSLWQISLIQICLVSGHLFTGNPGYYRWFTRRLNGMNLESTIERCLSEEFLRALTVPGGSLAIVRTMVVQVMIATANSHTSGIPLVDGIRTATTYVEWSGMAWAFLALTLVMRNAHPILLVPSVRREAVQLSETIRTFRADLSRLPFERILGLSQIAGLNAGNYPTLSSAAYGVAAATYENFSGFQGKIFSQRIYRAAQFLTQVIIGADDGAVDPFTGLSGTQMKEAAECVTNALQDTALQTGASKIGTI